MFLFVLVALAVPIAPPGHAVCSIVRRAVPGWPAWSRAHPVSGDFAIGRAVELRPVAVANVRLRVQPSKPLTGDYMASASFEVAKTGTYRVAVGGATEPVKPLWLDIASADDKPLASGGHSHGPDCSSITKIVDYDLKPGRYTILVTGLVSNDQTIRALIVRK